jgi:L-threonylcarbamoyladenylate synthase
MEIDLLSAYLTLKTGGTILYPTDTIWGIGCDAINEQAIEKIYQVKNRTDKKGMLVLLDRMERLQEYVTFVPEAAWHLMEEADRPLTLIYPGARNLPPNLLGDDGSIGIRITNDHFCQKLIHRLGHPLVSTSANISTSPPPQIFNDISAEIIGSVDYVVRWRQEEDTPGEASRIIRLHQDGTYTVIRE